MTGGSLRLVAGLALPLVGLSLLGAAPARAQTDRWPTVPPGPVAEIRLIVDGQPSTDPTLVRLLGVRTGGPVLPSAVRETIVHLMALGRFDDVQARVDPSSSGLVLTFEATSTRRVTGLVFKGNLGLTSGELRAAVTERYTSSPPLGRAGEIASTLTTLCRDHGFRSAKVAYLVEPAPQPDRATLVFDIGAGPQVRARALTVTGEAGTAEAQVLERCGLRPDQPFDPVVVRRKASAFADSLHALRYFEATAVPSFTYSESGETADVTVTVVRGPLVTLAFTGDPLPPSRIAELVPIEREASVDEDLLEDAQRNIETFLRSQGYSDAKAAYSRETSDGQLRIVFDVRRGPQFRVGSVDLAGNQAVTTAELRAGLRLQPGTVYEKSLVDADVATLSERYRRLGYTAAKVTPVEQRELKSGAPNQGLVRIRLTVAEGVRTLTGDVRFEGNARLTAAELAGVTELRTGRPFYPATLERDRQAVLIEYLNRGFQTATVEAPIAFSDDRQTVTVTFRVREGPQILVDHILIVGATKTKAETIERELQVKTGMPLTLTHLMQSQERLAALGLFSRVSVTELPRGSETTRDVLVSVVEAPAATFSYGGGLEGSRRLLREGPGGSQTVERFQFAPRGFFDIGRRNLWGKNRTINFFARLSVRPTDPAPVSSEPDAVWVGGGLGVSDYRAQLSYTEPRVLSDLTDLTVTGLAEQGYRSSFNYTRQLGRAELRRRFGRGVTLSGSFSVENNHLFDERFNAQEQLLIDRAFPQVRFSIIGATLSRDKRDDALDPSSGSLTSIDGQLASRFLGSEVGFVKTFAQGYVFHRLPGSQRVVLAGGARIGLATGFPTQTPVIDAEGNPVLGPDGKPLTVTVTNIPASERFYAGGETTVRAFTRDRLGTPNTIDSDGFPHGGMGMLIFNGEVRFSLWKWIGAVGFVDVGNVFFRVSEIKVNELRPAIGGGLRLRLPILPLIRLDVGYNPSPRTFDNGSREKSYGIYLGIGQAF